MSVIPHLDAKRRVMGLLPVMDGWAVFEDVATGAHPPWIVVRFGQIGRALSEAVAVTSRIYTLEVRVVGASADSVNVACDRYQEALDGRHPDGMGALVPDVDSGVYAAELTDPDTGFQYVMRVLSWRCGQ